MNKRNVSYAISVFLVVFLVITVIGQAAVPSVVTYLSPGSLTETASYVFWEDSGNYYAKNGETGQVTSSTNASYLINIVVDALPDAGGKLLFKPARYEMTGYIDLVNKYFIILEGESIAWASPAESELQQTTGLYQTADIGAGGLIHIDNTGNHIVPCIVIKNLKLLGQYGAEGWLSSGVRLAASNRIIIEDCTIHDFYRGIDGRSGGDADFFNRNFINRCWRGIQFTGSNTFISNNQIGPNESEGIYVGGDNNQLTDNLVYATTNGNGITIATGDMFSKVFVQGGVVYWNSEHGILIGNSMNCSVSGVKIYNNTEGGISFYGSTTLTMNNIVTDCFITDNGVGIQGGGEGENVSDYNLIYGNVITDNTLAVLNLGDNTKIFGNMGYITENWGVASGTTNITVTHGLAGTPDTIILTDYQTYGGASYVTNQGATTFDIVFDGGGTRNYYWYAFYKP